MEYLIVFGIILVVGWWRGRSSSKPGHGMGNVFGGWTWARGGRPEVFGWDDVHELHQRRPGADE